MKSTAFCVTLFALLLQLTSASRDEERLLSTLLIGYDKMARPVVRNSEPIRVKMGVALREAVSLDEHVGQMKVLMWIKTIWQDVFLQWNPNDYGGVNQAYIHHDRVWTPDIVLYNAVRTTPDDIQDQLKLTVTYEGVVTWVRPVTYTVTCKHAFRGDAWTCPFSFGSWVYHGLHLQLEPDRDSVDIDADDYLATDHFTLLGHSGKRRMKEYKCCPEPYITMDYEIKLRKKIGMPLLGK